MDAEADAERTKARQRQPRGKDGDGYTVVELQDDDRAIIERARAAMRARQNGNTQES